MKVNVHVHDFALMLNVFSVSRLYKSVNEYDVLLGIFGSKIGTQSITREAVEAEARGDYQLAYALYEKVGQELYCRCCSGFKINFCRPV
jgi:hypothetical protein